MYARLLNLKGNWALAIPKNECLQHFMEWTAQKKDSKQLIDTIIDDTEYNQFKISLNGILQTHIEALNYINKSINPSMPCIQL